MIDNKKILAIIPARGGSKRVPRKNVKLLSNKPLISYTISAALKSKYIDKTIVSTDNKEIARIARQYEADIPFIRPSELAHDDSTTLSVLKHAVKFMEKSKNFKPDLVILIQPTSPLVLAEDIDMAIEKIIETKTNSCVSVCEISERPEWMFHLSESGKIRPFLKKKNKITNSQQLPKVYRLNGAIYITRRDILIKNNIIIDEDSSSAIVMPPERSIDIDRPIDFIVAEALIKTLL